ncbi:MAG: hypothetical protein ACNA7W_04255, partial [Pseudomonadales bacterium]
WRFWRFGLLMVASLTAGCALLQPPASEPSADVEPPPPAAEPALEPSVVPEPAELTPAEAALVRQLLVYADYAIAADQLTSPYPGSALAHYHQVEQLQPDNPEARRGVERIVERYLELALTAAERQQFAGAEEMLDRGRLVDPNHPGIAPMQAQVELLASARRRTLRLDGGLLRAQDASVKQALEQAGRASRADDCRVEITARNDAEGRWIYQQLSGAEGSERIRAQLSVGSPPTVELLCFPASD